MKSLRIVLLVLVVLQIGLMATSNVSHHWDESITADLDVLGLDLQKCILNPSSACSADGQARLTALRHQLSHPPWFVRLTDKVFGLNRVNYETPAAAECKVLKPIPPPSPCKQTTLGIECEFGDIAPETWGTCLEDTDRKFSCVKDGMVSFYGDEKSGTPTKQMKEADCPALADQIKKGGRSGANVEIPLTPTKGKAKPTGART